MFRLLATTKCKRQQIAILIISFFAYVAGIRNEANNMLLQQQQQQQLLQQQKTALERTYYESPIIDVKQQQPTLNFRPSETFDFTAADAGISQQLIPTYKEFLDSTNNNIVIRNNNKNSSNNILTQKQEMQNVNRRFTIATAATNDKSSEKPFSFPNEQQQIPQHLTDKPIFIYRDPFTNENFHYTPTETDGKYTTTIATTYNHNNYNNYNKQQNSQHQLRHRNNDNQEYFVQSSMIVGAHQHQHQQQQQHNQHEANPSRPYMSLSADKDVYLKRPGFVYDERPSYNHPNSVIDKKSEEIQTLKVNKISYDSHDYPPPSYFQQQTSNFLPTPVPPQPSTPRPTPPPTPPLRQDLRPNLQTHSTIFNKQRPQQQYLQSTQSTLHNYANSIDNYLWNKQQTSDYYRTEIPPPLYFQQKQQQQPLLQHQYDSRPPLYEYDTRPQSSPTPNYNFVQNSYPKYETTRPPPGRPSYNNYHDYQIGEIPPQAQILSPLSQVSQFNNPYPKPPPPQYPYQGPYRPQPPPQQQHQSGLATLAQYAPQFTSLFLSGIGGGAAVSNSNGPLGSLIGALTGAAPAQHSSLSSSHIRRPINSQLIKALENIARNDDLQCVPKVLCQMIAAQTQRGQLPTFITSPAITNFLSEFPAASPALIYGRAALLGLSGGEKSCYETYAKCPKSEYEIIYYLNNHRGGFFKFFSEPEDQQQTVQNQNPTQQGPTSLFSILAALTGSPQATTTTPRPTPKPQAPSTDITSGIGNFFTQLLSDYMGGARVEYQRRTKRSLDDKIKFEGESESVEYNRDVIKFQDENRGSQGDVLKFKDKYEYYDVEEPTHPDNDEDFHDEEDEEDTQQGVGFKYVDHDYLDQSESRILLKNPVGEKRLHFFPDIKKETADEVIKDDEIMKIIEKFNRNNRKKILKFPTTTDERVYVDASSEKVKEGKTVKNDLTNNEQNYGHHFTNYVENSYDDFQKKTHNIKFIENDNNEDKTQSLYSDFSKGSPKALKTHLVFPERTGKILNRPYYAASYLHHTLKQEQLVQETEVAQEENKFVLPNTEEGSVGYTEFPSTIVYNTHISSLNSPANLDTNVNDNYFLPTPSPLHIEYTSSNVIYSNQNKHNQDNLKHSSYYKTQKYPSATSFATSTFNGAHKPFDKPERYIYNKPTNLNRYLAPDYTTRRPSYTSKATTRKPDNKNIYVTNSQGVTEYFLTPDGRKVYL